MIARLKDIFTQRREVSILRASLSRVAAERDAARADRDRAEDAALRSFRRRLCLALYGVEHTSATVDELLARVEHLAGEVDSLTTWRNAVCDLLCIPRTSSIEDVREEIEPEGWPEGWEAIVDVAEFQTEEGGWVYARVRPSASYAWAVGPDRRDRATIRDARALAATLARRMRQEKP